MARHAEGGQPEVVRVPEEKTRFPRLLFLDINKWVELAQAHHGKPAGANAVDALAAIRLAVDSGRLVVPITSANAFEATKNANGDRRRRLASFMVDLSHNHFTSGWMTVGDRELNNAIRLSMLNGAQRARRIPVRSAMLQLGLNGCIGPRMHTTTGNRAMDALVNDIASEPEISIHTLSDMLRRDTVRNIQQLEKRGAKKVARIRQVDLALQLEARLAIEMSNLFAGGSIATRLREQARLMGVADESLQAWLAIEGNPVRLAKTIPSVWVGAQLMLHHDKNIMNETKENDGFDYEFLSTALPYGNYVVTESLWVDIARQSGLADFYDTEIFADLRRLPGLLKSDDALVSASD
jgi:hypothetical protein